MEIAWNVKAIYNNGGHRITDKDGIVLRYPSEAAAKDEAAMRNMNKKDSDVYYIAVKEP